MDKVTFNVGQFKYVIHKYHDDSIEIEAQHMEEFFSWIGTSVTINTEIVNYLLLFELFKAYQINKLDAKYKFIFPTAHGNGQSDLVIELITKYPNEIIADEQLIGNDQSDLMIELITKQPYGIMADKKLIKLSPILINETERLNRKIINYEINSKLTCDCYRDPCTFCFLPFCGIVFLLLSIAHIFLLHFGYYRP